jgi:hypothetical protein
MATTLLVWIVMSLVATVEESRTTWLLFGLIALAGQLAVEEPESLTVCFADGDMRRGGPSPVGKAILPWH